MGVQLFPPIFNLGRSTENEIVEPWKFNLKMRVGGWRWWAILRTERNLRKCNENLRKFSKFHPKFPKCVIY